jgi:hypothetical protein
LLSALLGVAVAVAGSWLGGGVATVAAASTLLRKGWRGGSTALTLVAFPGVLACLWAFDVLKAVGPAAIEHLAFAAVHRRRRPSSLGGSINALAAAAAVATTEHLARLPARAARVGYWRAAWRIAGPCRGDPSPHRWAARGLLAAALVCALAGLLWRTSLFARFAALCFGADAALKSRAQGERRQRTSDEAAPA